MSKRLEMLAIAGLGLRSLPHRIGPSLAIIVALVCLTVFPLAIIAMGASLRASYLSTGAPDRVMILFAGARRQSDSHISPLWIDAIRSAPGIRRWHDGPLVDFEISKSFHPRKKGKVESGNTRLRGMGPLGFVLRPELKLISGRLPRAGSREIIVGVMAQRKFDGLNIGEQAEIAGQLWRVVGTFQTGGNLDGDAIGDADTLKTVLHRGSYDIALLALKSASSYPLLRDALRKLPVTPIPETEYYERMWEFVPKLALYTACILLVIIGGGALAATTQSVYAAISSRAREIVLLRSLGFNRVVIAVSVISEAVLLAFIGAFIGTFIVWLWVDGYPYNGGLEGGVFPIHVDAFALITALSWALIVALLGAVTPSIKASRGTVADAIRDL